MKHLKLFENNKNEIYLVQIFDSHGFNTNFAFYDLVSRDNFLINYIHENYAKNFDIEYYADIKDIFSVDNLIDEFNTDYNYIELYTIEVQENVKLEPELQIRKDKLEYNL